jgi:energy-coupling factor transporter ATP-binding protein EcfA2
LKKVTIKNFKCWENVSIDLKPLTVLIGPNGSGKSSVLQALSLLKRFVVSPGGVSFDNLGDFAPAEYLNLGRFDELIHKHEQEREMTIQIEVLEDGKIATYSASFGKKTCRGQLALEDPPAKLSVEFSLPYSLNVTTTKSITFSVGEMKKGYTVIWNGVSASIQMATKKEQPPKEVVALLNAHMTFLKGIYLIHGRQFFKTWTYPYAPSIDYSKLYMTDQELANILATNSDIEEKVAYWTEEILGVEVLAKSLPPGPTLKVESRLRRFRVPLSLEGAGLNRLVYILTNLALPTTRMLLVEEPEAHLHPKHLFALGQRLTGLLKQERKQMIITTHNEHVLLALLTGLAEGSINRDDFIVYYLERDGLSAKARKLEINEKGQVKGGLPGFFEADWETTEAYLRALAKGSGSSGDSS